MVNRNEMPMVLPFIGCWEVRVAAYDSEVFFAVLTELLPEASELYMEGSSVCPEAQAVFRAHESSGKYLPKSQVIWTTGNLMQFRCAFSPQFLVSLSRIAAHHSEAELVDALFAYKGEVVLLEWPKAFFGPIWIARQVSEERVKCFALGLGGSYKSLANEKA